MVNRYFRESQIVSTPGRPRGRYPISKATWLRWVRLGIAPRPIKLGPGVSAWSDEQLDAFDTQRAAQSGAPATDKPSTTVPAPAVSRNPCSPSRRPDAKRPGRPRKVLQEAMVPA